MSGELVRDPAFSPERACRTAPSRIFFPTNEVALSHARAVCASCPVLRRCATWAGPMVADRLLTETVIAGVLTPPSANKRYATARAAAVAELAAIAAGERDLASVA